MSWSPRWLAAGAALALAANAAAGSWGQRHRLSVHSAGLVGAALVYPAMHSASGVEPAVRHREALGVVGCAALTVLAARSTTRSRLLAAGWAAHALFDAVHHRGATSCLPDWYPALCAGYDLSLAASIALHERAQL